MTLRHAFLVLCPALWLAFGSTCLLYTSDAADE